MCHVTLSILQRKVLTLLKACATMPQCSQCAGFFGCETLGACVYEEAGSDEMCCVSCVEGHSPR